MAIFLSAGFIERKQTIKILYNNDTFSEIYACLRKISNILYSRGYNICFHSQSLADYLRNYTIDNRHVPHIIKQSTIDDIRTFLSVYAIINGNVRQQRKNEQNPEVIYYATDNRMMSDLCELIVRTGHYPMVNTIQKNNQQIYAIRECFSGEIATFQKEYVAYDAHVYDLTLATNHIMYIMRNGKCFWGSNCRCYEVPILNTEEEFWDVNNESSKNQIMDIPKGMRTWIETNENRILTAKERKTLPYWLQNNKDVKENTDILIMLGQAKKNGVIVQNIAESIAKKYGAKVTPLNLKSYSSLCRKINTERSGGNNKNINELCRDSARNTIVADKNVIDDIINELKKQEFFARYKKQLPQKMMGYSGNIINIKMPDGMYAEIQVNTPKMIYAKESPSVAKAIIGEDLWNKIHKETGIEGGLGHKLYEKIRVLNEKSKEAKALRLESIDYYNHFNN